MYFRSAVQVDISQRQKTSSIGTQCNRDLEEFDFSRRSKYPELKNEVNVYQNTDFDQADLHHMDEPSKDADYEPNFSDAQSDDLSIDDGYINYMNLKFNIYPNMNLYL